MRIESTSPVMNQMFEHAASTYNRHLCHADGGTPLEPIHGQGLRGRAAEFGEQVFYFVPKRLRAKLNLRWRVGTFLGNAQSTNECNVASSNGHVNKARPVIRVTLGSRWSRPAIEQICGTPM